MTTSCPKIFRGPSWGATWFRSKEGHHYIIMSTRSESHELSAALPAQSKHHGSGRHWTDEETAVLEKHWEEYREASDVARANIVFGVFEEMLQILHNRKSFKKKERSAVKKVIIFL